MLRNYHRIWERTRQTVSFNIFVPTVLVLYIPLKKVFVFHRTSAPSAFWAPPGLKGSSGLPQFNALDVYRALDSSIQQCAICFRVTLTHSLGLFSTK